MLPNNFLWRGIEKTYTLPWIKNKVEITGDPSRIAAFARRRFTRSTMLMDLLRHFHLSNHSILVSSDEHSAFLRNILFKKFPPTSDYPEIARDLVERIFDRSRYTTDINTAHISPMCVRETYITQLKSVLGVRILPPLQDFIEKTDFSPGWRPLRLEGLMYSLGLHSPIFMPLSMILDFAFFRESKRMRKISKDLEQQVYYFSEPAPESWFENLQNHLISGRISRAQFRGELTSILVSSFSLASALSFSLLCLAAMPQFVTRIRDEPTFSKYFLQEVLRLYPPFHQFGYQQSDCTGPTGDHGPPTDFIISAYYLHRNPDEWTHPNQFWPERFFVEQKEERFRYMPFGMGPRTCPGRSYSLRLISEVLKFVCSDSSPITFSQSDSLPTGRSDRIISFPIDDRIQFTYRTR